MKKNPPQGGPTLFVRFARFGHRPWGLPVLCYAAALLIWVGVSASHLASDAAAKARGTLAEQELQVTDFALADLEPVEPIGEAAGGTTEGAATLQTTSGDPQMILEDVSARTVRTLQMYATYTGTPREMCLYYTTAPGQPYSQDRRVFPALQPDGSYRYTLPRGRLVALRLDPCSPDEGKTVTMTVEKIILNRPVGAAGYFVPSWYQAFCLLLYPGLAAAALSWLAGLHTLLRKKANHQK